jgi:hypothetical protein
MKPKDHNLGIVFVDQVFCDELAHAETASRDKNSEG